MNLLEMAVSIVLICILEDCWGFGLENTLKFALAMISDC